MLDQSTNPIKYVTEVVSQIPDFDWTNSIVLDEKRRFFLDMIIVNDSPLRLNRYQWAYLLKILNTEKHLNISQNQHLELARLQELIDVYTSFGAERRLDKENLYVDEVFADKGNNMGFYRNPEIIVEGDEYIVFNDQMMLCADNMNTISQALNIKTEKHIENGGVSWDYNNGIGFSAVLCRLNLYGQGDVSIYGESPSFFKRPAALVLVDEGGEFHDGVYRE